MPKSNFKIVLNTNLDAEDDEAENESESDNSEMEIDAPEIEPNESLEDYFKRTNEIWLEEAANEFPDEKSKKIIKKMAFELCAMFWESCKSEDTKKDAD